MRSLAIEHADVVVGRPSMSNLHHWGIAALILSASAMAQVGLGGKPPAPNWQQWLRGAPVDVAGPLAPGCTVFAFYSQEPRLFSADGDYLAALQARFGAAGLRVVASVAAADIEGQDRWPGCSIVVDDAAQTEMAWTVVNGELRWNVLVVGPGGQVAFVGRPGAGLVDAIERVFAGQVDLAGEARAQRQRMFLPQGFDDAVGVTVAPLLAELVAFAPRDGLLTGLLYLAQATKVNDPAGARLVLQAALERLADEPRPLAVFADLALRGDPRRAGLAQALRAPLQSASAAAPADPVVQLAYLRALVLVGDGRQLGRQAMRVRKLVTGTADGCLDFASILTQDVEPQVHRDLATIALDKAERMGADARLLTAARYGVLVRCAGDDDRATRLMDDYLKDENMRVAINNDSWYLMTQLPTMGRFDWFACGLVERMLEQREGMDYFEFDTAALAMFLVGRNQEAVDLQQTAIDKGGTGNQEYLERLERYKAGLVPAPR